jgi:FkbM family methyltransferase
MLTFGDVTWKLRRLLNRVGVDIVPFRLSRHPIARREYLFNRYKIASVIDVGANCGQYGRFLRRIGYSGTIRSYEPLASAFADLKSAAAEDQRWEAHNLGLGQTEGVATLNVSENSESSSILPMMASHLHGYPQSRYVATETVKMTTLARVLEGTTDVGGVFVKVDTQGYEREVIEGAGNAISRVDGVQLEMSIIPLYEGESLLPEMITFMRDKGFVLMSVEPGSSDPQTGQLLQMDGLFFRPGKLDP